MSKLHSKVYQILEAKFGLINDVMTRTSRESHMVFFNTQEPRVKVCLQCNKNKIGEPTSVYITLAVEDEGRPGVFFALGDRLHLDPIRFPEFKFHHDLNAKLSFSSARTDLNIGDVFSFAKELTEKL